jgi:hypothetical protein
MYDIMYARYLKRPREFPTESLLFSSRFSEQPDCIDYFKMLR